MRDAGGDGSSIFGELADTHAFDAWYALWTEDALYWVPANEDDIDPLRHVSIVYEDLEKIETRLFRLKGKRAHAQQPKSRLARVVSNLVMNAIRHTPADGAVVVEATAAEQEITLSVTDACGGIPEDELARVDAHLTQGLGHGGEARPVQFCFGQSFEPGDGELVGDHDAPLLHGAHEPERHRIVAEHGRGWCSARREREPVARVIGARRPVRSVGEVPVRH